MPHKHEGRIAENWIVGSGLAIIVILIIGTMIWAVTSTNDSISKTSDELSEFYLAEIMGQREQMLKDSLDRYYGRVERMTGMLEDKGIADRDSARSFLADIERIYNVEKVALVDDEGTVYTAHSTFSDASRYTMLQQDFTETKIVAANLYGAKKQIVIASPVHEVAIDGSSIVAGFMEINIDDVVGTLDYDINGNSGETYTGLYYENGDNLATTADGVNGSGENLFTLIENNGFAEAEELKKLEKDFADGGQGLIVLNNAGESEYFYYIPVENTDWMLTLLIRDNTIEDRLTSANESVNQTNITRMLIMILLIIVIVVIIVFLSRRNNELRMRQMELEARAENEEALRQARDEAEAANNAKTRFLFNMSHDIRTPMNAILGYTDLMKKHEGDKEKFEDYLKKIRSSGEFLLELINNVLEMARIESGKVELYESVCDAEEMAENIYSVFEADMASKNIDYTREVHVENRYSYGDSLKLREIFLNLMSNAYKYTPAGGQVKLKLEELPSDREGFVLYRTTISDSGIGMSEDYLPHVFEEFTRETTATESKIQGTGLGMPIVKRLIDLMGGEISVTSKTGVGTTFVVTVYHKIASADEYVKKEGFDDISLDLGSCRILLAEDNDLNAEIATEILEETGAAVERAEDGEICVKMLEEAEDGYYDIILMDIQMPHLDGYGATRKIRAMEDPAKAGIPIVAMTANAFDEDKRDAFEAGMNSHMAKPIDIKELMRILSEYLR